MVRELAEWQKTRMPVAIGISHKKGHCGPAIQEAQRLGAPVYLHQVPWRFRYSSAVLLPPLKEWYRRAVYIDDSARWIVHFHNGPGIGFAFWPFRLPGRRFLYPAVNTFHGLPPEDVIVEPRCPLGILQTKINGFLVRKMQRSNIALATVSRASRTQLSRLYRIREEVIEVVYNGTSDPRKEKIESAAGSLPSDSFRVGFVGSIEKNKRWDIALEAVVRLHDNGRNVRLLIAGDGEDTEIMKAAIKPHAGFVEYLGVVPEAGKILIPTLDCLVLPSRQEGQPMVILEAMAAGVPVIATSVGAIPETIEDGATGYLIRQDSAPDLAECLLRIMGDSKALADMRINCLNEWRRMFSVDKMGTAYLELYERTLHER